MASDGGVLEEILGGVVLCWSVRWVQLPGK